MAFHCVYPQVFHLCWGYILPDIFLKYLKLPTTQNLWYIHRGKASCSKRKMFNWYLSLAKQLYWRVFMSLDSLSSCVCGSWTDAFKPLCQWFYQWCWPSNEWKCLQGSFPRLCIPRGLFPFLLLTDGISLLVLVTCLISLFSPKISRGTIDFQCVRPSSL